MNDITGSINVTIPMITAEIHAKSHANLDHIHLNSARIFVQSAFSIENKYKTQKNIPQETIDSHMSYVSSSIICSVAALEAYINQLIVDLQNQFNSDNFKQNKHTKFIKKTIKLFNDKSLFDSLFERNKPTLSKFKIISFLLTNKDLPHNKPTQAIEFLIDLRNHLIHFTPEWDNNQKKHKNLESTYNNQYKSVFKLSPFFTTSAIFFPYRCLSADCAKWGYEISSLFINNFSIKHVQK